MVRLRMGRGKAGDGLVDLRLAKALSHPLRARILVLLNEQVASPNMIAGELGEPLGNVSYHVKALAELGCVELVRTEPRRGAIEHFYRAVTRPFFSDRDWKRLPASLRRALTDSALRLIWDDAAEAVRAGTFESRDDRHLSRTPLVLDEQGWKEVNRLLLALLEEVPQIEGESSERLAASGEPGFHTRMVLMHFESRRPG